MIKELKLINTYKIFFEEIRVSITIYEWADSERSYFTQIHNTHFSDLTEKDCLGNTKKEAIDKLKEMFEIS